ncbi:MAG TPA: glycosyltransferase family 39 protein [Roseiflexaceae bacterium]
MATSIGAAVRMTWRVWLACAILALIYLVARLPALLAMPLFNDEAVYILRAQVFPALLSDTLSEGKLLQEVFLAALMRLPGDPLILSRLLSIACGLATLGGLLLLGRALDQPEAGWLAGLLYAGAPIAALHDRLGLPDSMLTSMACFVMLGSIEFARAPRSTRGRALLIGALIGLASLVKLPGLFLLCIPVLAVLILPDSWPERRQRLALLRLAAIVALLCIAILAPTHYGGNERGKTYFTTLGERAALVGQNLQFVGGWLASYLPAPLLALPLASLALARPVKGADWRPVTFLLAVGLVVHGSFLLVGTTLYPRYLMPAWPALLLACALSAAQLWRVVKRARWVGRAICLVALGATLVWDGFFIARLQSDPAAAPLVALDRRQYLETWTAGYNLPEMLDLLKRIAIEQGGIILINHNQPRLVHLAPLIYLRDDPRLRFEQIDLREGAAQAWLRQRAGQRPTYLLFDDQEIQALDLPHRLPELRLRRIFENPLGTMHFFLYEQPHP